MTSTRGYCPVHQDDVDLIVLTCPDGSEIYQCPSKRHHFARRVRFAPSPTASTDRGSATPRERSVQ